MATAINYIGTEKTLHTVCTYIHKGERCSDSSITLGFPVIIKEDSVEIFNNSISFEVPLKEKFVLYVDTTNTSKENSAINVIVRQLQRKESFFVMIADMKLFYSSKNCWYITEINDCSAIKEEMKILAT